MNRERLEKVIEALEAPLPEDMHFNLGVWVNSYECGTEACAVGLYCLANPHGELTLSVPDGRPRLRDRPVIGMDAVARHFGISREEGFWLFSLEGYREEMEGSEKPPWNVSRRVVARRIREFIAKRATEHAGTVPATAPSTAQPERRGLSTVPG